jgi:hypothetical protein
MLASVVVVLALGIAAFLIEQSAPSSGSPQVGRLGEVTLERAELSHLAAAGYVLTPSAHAYIPKVSPNDAARASPSNREIAVNQIVLAHLETSNLGGISSEVWIVSYDPNDPRAHNCPGAQGIYDITLVNANTGQAVATLSEEKPPLGCGGPLGS